MRYDITSSINLSKMAKWVLFINVLFFSVNGEEHVECRSGQQCVPMAQCQLTNTSTVIFPCHSGLNLICCPSKNVKAQQNANVQLDNRKRATFPVDCGVVEPGDKISGGQKAELGQFPWMALLGYQHKSIPITQYVCGGSIITEFYILTAAHCIFLEHNLQLMTVRLGEHNLQTDPDCEKYENDSFCADRPVDYSIDKTLPHKGFNNTNLKNDIALIRVAKKITFTDYIKPICLPFGRSLDKQNLAKERFIVSGWGKTVASNAGGSTTLLFAGVTVWDEAKCNRNVPPNVMPIDARQICANGPKAEDACKGDSGGPLVNATVDRDKELRFLQVGVVSFAASLTCGNPELPTVYTRLDQYLSWIIDNVVV